MSQNDGRGDVDSIDGMPIADAVDEIVGRDAARDPEVVRATLDRVAEDRVVSDDAVDDELAEASKVVSTAETRTELAGIALSDARTEAASGSDLDSVAARLDAFESRLKPIEERATRLGSDLETLVERAGEGEPIYEIASGIRRLTADANAVQQTADELKLDLERFERWAANPNARLREVQTDVDAVESSLDQLATAADEVVPSAGRDTTEPKETTTSDVIAAGITWADLRLRHRVLALLLADVRAELADLGTWADRECVDDEGRLDEIEDRLADLDTRLAELGDHFDDIARPEWTVRFGDRLAAFETATDDLEPPLDWGEIQTAFDEHRPKAE